MQLDPPLFVPAALAPVIPIRFWVDGIPKGQPRPRAFTRMIGGRAVARVFNPAEAEGWKGLISLAARVHCPPSPLNVPLALSVAFYLPRPKSLMRRKDPDEAFPATCKPDLDNALKAVMDCLTQLGFWRDDALVTDLVARKLLCAKNGRPGALVTIRAVNLEG